MAFNSNQSKVERFAAVKQRRLDQLLDKNAEGFIGRDEKDELVALVAEAEQLMTKNARQLASGNLPPNFKLQQD